MSSSNLGDFCNNGMGAHPLIVILGPTAVGKTEMSINLAETCLGEIISADSRLFYKGMDIGTAKPSREDRNRVRHFLIDVSEPEDLWNLARFKEAATDIIADIATRNLYPLLVGGTGQYIRALTEGWSIPEVAPNPVIRVDLERKIKIHGNVWLFDYLKKLDPQAAEFIDYRNTRRVIRALEVILSTDMPYSSQRYSGQCPYKVIKIGLIRPRSELYARVDSRIESMFTRGLVDEVKLLLDRGISPNLPSMSSIGYQECAQVINNQLSVEQAKVLMKRRTRIFIRRQANWFRLNDGTIRWFDLSRTSEKQLIFTIKELLGGIYAK